MAAPERFAETSDFSCTAGAVHTWLKSRDPMGRYQAVMAADGLFEVAPGQ